MKNTKDYYIFIYILSADYHLNTFSYFLSISPKKKCIRHKGERGKSKEEEEKKKKSCINCRIFYNGRDGFTEDGNERCG
jgi:hypothetical protein